jgi:hypothetical protein
VIDMCDCSKYWDYFDGGSKRRCINCNHVEEFDREIKEWCLF